MSHFPPEGEWHIEDISDECFTKLISHSIDNKKKSYLRVQTEIFKKQLSAKQNFAFFIKAREICEKWKSAWGNSKLVPEF